MLPLLTLLPHVPRIRMSSQLFPVRARIVPRCFSRASGAAAPSPVGRGRGEVLSAHPRPATPVFCRCPYICQDQNASIAYIASTRSTDSHVQSTSTRTSRNRSSLFSRCIHRAPCRKEAPSPGPLSTIINHKSPATCHPPSMSESKTRSIDRVQEVTDQGLAEAKRRRQCRPGLTGSAGRHT